MASNSVKSGSVLSLAESWTTCPPDSSTRITRMKRNRRCDVLIGKGQHSLLDDKQYSRAVSYFSRAIPLITHDEPAPRWFIQHMRAQAYMELKNYQCAIKDCQSVLENEVTCDNRFGLGQTALMKGNAHQKMAQYSQAIASYRRAKEIDPGLSVDQLINTAVSCLVVEKTNPPLTAEKHARLRKLITALNELKKDGQHRSMNSICESLITVTQSITDSRERGVFIENGGLRLAYVPELRRILLDDDVLTMSIDRLQVLTTLLWVYRVACEDDDDTVDKMLFRIVPRLVPRLGNLLESTYRCVIEHDATGYQAQQHINRTTNDQRAKSQPNHKLTSLAEYKKRQQSLLQVLRMTLLLLKQLACTDDGCSTILAAMKVETLLGITKTLIENSSTTDDDDAKHSFGLVSSLTNARKFLNELLSDSIWFDCYVLPVFNDMMFHMGSVNKRPYQRLLVTSTNMFSKILNCSALAARIAASRSTTWYAVAVLLQDQLPNITLNINQSIAKYTVYIMTALSMSIIRDRPQPGLDRCAVFEVFRSCKKFVDKYHLLVDMKEVVDLCFGIMNRIVGCYLFHSEPVDAQLASDLRDFCAKEGVVWSALNVIASESSYPMFRCAVCFLMSCVYAVGSETKLSDGSPASSKIVDQILAYPHGLSLFVNYVQVDGQSQDCLHYEPCCNWIATLSAVFIINVCMSRLSPELFDQLIGDKAVLVDKAVQVIRSPDSQDSEATDDNILRCRIVCSRLVGRLALIYASLDYRVRHVLHAVDDVNKLAPGLIGPDSPYYDLIVSDSDNESSSDESCEEAEAESDAENNVEQLDNDTI